MIPRYTQDEQRQIDELAEQYNDILIEKRLELDSIEASEENQSERYKTVYDEWSALERKFLVARRALLDQFEDIRFDKIKDNPDKILKNVRTQATALINNRYKGYKQIIKNKKDDPDSNYLGFQGFDLRVDGINFWLDAETITNDIKSTLRRHYAALKDDPERLQEIDKIIEEVVSSSDHVSSTNGILWGQLDLTGITKRTMKPRSKQVVPVFSESSPQDFFMFSTTQPMDVFYSLLSGEGNMKEIVNRINAINKKEVAKYNEGTKNGRALQVETDKTKTVYEILESVNQDENEHKGFRPAIKILFQIKEELYQRCFYDGTLINEVIEFPLQKLVDEGSYTTTNNARRAFNDAGEIMTAIRGKGYVKSKNATTASSSKIMTLFVTWTIKNGQCVVRCNPDVNWAPFLNEFFYLPDSWKRLPDNAADLEFEIFRRMRMNKDKVDKHGKMKFNIPLETVANWLYLPINDKKNPKRNVKQPIETAVTQINESLDTSFKIKIKTDLNAPLSQYLKGYLEVTAGGVYTKNLFDLQAKQQGIVEKALAKHDAIVTEASIRKLEKQMEIDDLPKSNAQI